jgi:hypothetical protein
VKLRNNPKTRKAAGVDSGGWRGTDWSAAMYFTFLRTGLWLNSRRMPASLVKADPVHDEFSHPFRPLRPRSDVIFAIMAAK